MSESAERAYVCGYALAAFLNPKSERRGIVGIVRLAWSDLRHSSLDKRCVEYVCLTGRA
jgi:hypothetical protein